MIFIRHSILFFILSICTFSVVARINRASLLQLAQNGKTKYEIRLNAYKHLIESYSRTHPILILDLTDQALLLANSQKDTAFIVEMYINKGGAFQVMGLRDSAFYYYQKSLTIAETLQDHTILGASNNVIARFFRIIEPNRSLPYYENALTHYQIIHDTGGIAMIYNESGVAYEYANNFQEALARYQKSLALQIIRKDSVGIGYSLEFIGGVLTKMKAYKEAEIYLLDALKYRTILKDTFNRAPILSY